MRNNPLKLVDPTGKKADYEITVDAKTKTVTVKITASIGIWSKDKDTKVKLDAIKNNIEKQIEAKWSGSIEKDGYTFNVSTDVTVKVFAFADSNDHVLEGDKNMQNVIEITANEATASGVSNPETDPNAPPVSRKNPDGTKPDLAIWRAKSSELESEPAHEFGHLLGIGIHVGQDGSANVMAANSTAGRFTKADYNALPFQGGVEARQAMLRRVPPSAKNPSLFILSFSGRTRAK